MRIGGRAVGRSGGKCILSALLLTALSPARLSAQCPDGSPPPCRAPARVASAAPAPNSVAVLYFDNLSRDTADAYLVEGLTEEITTKLGQLDRLTVTSRTTMRRYRGATSLDPAALARAMRVVQLVNGSLRRSGNRLRVSVELLRARDGVQLWAQSYDRTDADLLSVEAEVATAVATAIAGRLLPEERSALAARSTGSPEAYDHFLRGNFYLAQRTSRAVARAIEEYRTATQLDPGFTRALARIGYAYALFLDWEWDYPGAPRESLLARGFTAADSVLRRDSSASDAWMARAYLLSLRDTKTPAGALEAFERAIALDPWNAEGYHQYGSVLVGLGRDSAAAGAYQRALHLDPERPITLLQLGALRMIERRYDEALRWLDSALSVDPGFAFAYAYRALCRLMLGQTRQARGDAEVAVRLGSGYPGEAALATVEAREGDTLSGRTRIDNLLRGAVDSLRPNSKWEGQFLGWALVALNERERAIDLLERVRPRGWQLWYRLQHAGFDPLRADLRFQRLVEEARPSEGPR